MDTGLKGKLVLVTGGAAGLGRAIARAFAEQGANLILVDINEQGLADTSGEISNLGVSCEDAARRVAAALATDPRVSAWQVRVAHFESLHPHDAVASVSGRNA